MTTADLFMDHDFIISVFESSYDGIYLTNRDGVTLYVNSAYEKLVGLPRETFVGRSMEDLMNEGLMNTHITNRVVSSGETITETEILASGREVIITGNPIRNGSGEIIAVMTNVRDISEIISLEEEARRCGAKILHLWNGV